MKLAQTLTTFVLTVTSTLALSGPGMARPTPWIMGEYPPAMESEEGSIQLRFDQVYTGKVLGLSASSGTTRRILYIGSVKYPAPGKVTKGD